MYMYVGKHIYIQVVLAVVSPYQVYLINRAVPYSNRIGACTHTVHSKITQTCTNLVHGGGDWL